MYSGDDLGQAIPWPAERKFAIGQKVDMSQPGGNFDALTSFGGKLTQFNVWDEILTAEKIKRMSESCYNYVGTLVAWNTLLGEIHGDVFSDSQHYCRSLRHGRLKNGSNQSSGRYYDEPKCVINHCT